MAKRSESEKRVVGQVARSGSHTVRSYQVGAMPILRRIFDRMALVDKLREHLPKESKRMRVPTAETLQILVANILIARQPIYGVGDWAVRYAPDLFGLSATQLALLQDDRIGRCLDRLFRINVSDLVMDVMRGVVQEFHLDLEELHNDSTTISFHGDYDDAREPGKRFGNPTIALTWGHNKDHRPDLKQLLYILTLTDDGGVPIYFTTANGNTTDDRTHVETWNLLRQLVGHADFLYVADCKLATKTNMQHIDKRKGRFVTILPRTRKENQEFHDRVRRDPTVIPWRMKLMPIEVYGAYKRQPMIEKRFSQFKNDFAVAPIFLKNVTRIQSLLCVYFFALMAQTLLERELRRAMEHNKVGHLPLYPEQRKCTKPTTSRLIDVFGGIQRHQVTMDGERIETVTQLSQVQRHVLKLLRMPIRDYGCKEA